MFGESVRDCPELRRAVRRSLEGAEGGGKGKGLQEFCRSEFDFSTSAPLGKPQLRADADADEELGMWCGDGRSFTGWIVGSNPQKLKSSQTLFGLNVGCALAPLC